MNLINELSVILEDTATEIVSFDVFDTLLLRPVFEPEDVFYLVGLLASEKEIWPNNALRFVKQRVRAEKIARRKEKNKQDIDLEQIYYQLQKMMHLSDYQILWIMNCEKEVEYQISVPRKMGEALFRKAIAAGKTVVCISDMYLSAEFIRKLLNKQKLFPDRIFVSSEYGLSKQTGDLYAVVLKELAVKDSKKVVHIGDNLYSDVEMAKNQGINGIWIPKTIDCWKKNTISIPRRLVQRCREAEQANELYDNPFIPGQKNGTRLISSKIEEIFPGFVTKEIKYPLLHNITKHFY